MIRVMRVRRDLVIRKMDMSDIHFIVGFEMEAFGKTLSEPMLVRELLYNDLAHYFVAISGKERVGYIGFWVTKPNAEVLNIVVTPKWQFRGVGKQLMGVMFERCAKMDVVDITCEVRVLNGEAIRFYEALGFRKATVRKKYYPDGEDAYLMVKRLGVNQ